MSVNTHLPGRLRNTPLPYNHGLMPLFEAVVNSIHSIAEANPDPDYGEVVIEILRAPQSSLQFNDDKVRRGAPPQEPIVGFKVTDNGIGFHDENMRSFETLDSEYKASQGCRGVGRLLWLKAFEGVSVSSVYRDSVGGWKTRSFTFTAKRGVADESVGNAVSLKLKTSVHLSGFKDAYRERTVKSARTIANSLLEHCLWYFVRDCGAPKIIIIDEFERLDLNAVLDDYMHSSSQKVQIQVKGKDFELTHLKLKASTVKSPFIAWCAANRVVEQESISGKVSGLHGKIKDPDGDFVYACYVTSSFLDENVRPERIGFDIEESTSDIFTFMSVSLSDIRDVVLSSSSSYLEKYLEESKQAGRERVERFVSHRAPRYRPILKRIGMV